MPPEKNPKDIEGDLHRFLEENGGSTESALPTTEEIVPEVKESFLTHAFGDKPFEFTEQSGQSTAVARKDDGSLSFDKATLDTAEMEMIQEFLEASESPAELAKSKFGWFFAEEDPQFIRQLREHLAKRLALGADGARAELRSANLDDELKTRLDSAADFFRNKAKREQIHKELQSQISRLPFRQFLGRKIGKQADGSPFLEEKLNFDPDDVLSPNSDIDFLYVNNNGKPELLISCKKAGYEITGIKGFGKESEWSGQKKFGVDWAGVKKKTDPNPYDGVDSTCFEIEITEGGTGETPMFDKVRVYTSPMDLGKQIDKLNQEKEAKRQAEEARKRNAQAASRQPAQPYTAAPPSVPSTPQAPRWQAPSPTVIRSG